MTRRIARDLALALLESLARERLHHLVGFGEPSLARPVHAPPPTQLHQAIRSLHVSLLLVVGSAPQERENACKASAIDDVRRGAVQARAAWDALGRTDADSRRGRGRSFKNDARDGNARQPRRARNSRQIALKASGCSHMYACPASAIVLSSAPGTHWAIACENRGGTRMSCSATVTSVGQRMSPSRSSVLCARTASPWWRKPGRDCGYGLAGRFCSPGAPTPGRSA